MPDTRTITLNKRTLKTLPIPPMRRDKKQNIEVSQYILYHDKVTRGLCVSVASSGRKSFVFYRRLGGQPVKRTIGSYPEMSVDEARQKVNRMNRVRMTGQNPLDSGCNVTEHMSLGELFERYIELYAKPHRRAWKQDVGIFNGHLKQWENREIASLTVSELQALHAELGKKRGKQIANRVRTILYALFAKAIEWGFDWPNPVARVKPFKRTQRDRFLQPEEIPQFFNTLKATDQREVVFDQTFQDYVLLLLYTGSRKMNLLSMRWADISFERAEWSISGEETKNGSPITVPLCSQTLKILKKRQKTATCDWVFPNPRGNAPMCEPRRTWEEFRQTSGLSDITIHDLRRTLGSWMAMTGASLPVIASALGHKLEKSSVTAVYARLNNEPVRKAVEKAVGKMIRDNKVG